MLQRELQSRAQCVIDISWLVAWHYLGVAPQHIYDHTETENSQIHNTRSQQLQLPWTQPTHTQRIIIQQLLSAMTKHIPTLRDWLAWSGNKHKHARINMHNQHMHEHH